MAGSISGSALSTTRIDSPPVWGGGYRELLDLVILGRSLNSSRGNGHTTFHRALVGALVSSGHRVLFLEEEDGARGDDLPSIRRVEVGRYGDLDELERRWVPRVRDADAVLVASSATDARDLGHWINDIAEGTTVFVDIDAPSTFRRLQSEEISPVERSLLRRYDVHLSLAGGPALRTLEQVYGCGAARAFLPMVDTRTLRPARSDAPRLQVGFLGARRKEREARLETMLLEPARREPRFVAGVAGAGYPEDSWPDNVERLGPLPPGERARFFGAQRFALHVTDDEQAAGCWSPRVGLYEAAACGVPVISSPWIGMEYFFRPGYEILVAESGEDVLRIVRDTDATAARMIGERARRRVLARDTAEHRASQLEQHLREARARVRAPDRPRPRSRARRPNGLHPHLRPPA